MTYEYENDELTLNPTQVFSVPNWALKPNQPEGPPFTDHMLAICNAEVSGAFKAPKTSSQTEKKFGLGQQPQPTFSFHTRLVVDEMHKEEQQAAGGPPSLGVTTSCIFYSEPVPGCDASADSTTEADPGIFAPHDFIPQQQEDEPIIITDESEKEEAERDEDTHTTSHDVPVDNSHMYPNVNQLTELLVTYLNPELSKILASHVFDRSIPPELKELPSKITKLSGEVKEVMKNVQEMEIKLPEDLKDIPNILETFTSIVTDTLNKIATIVRNVSPKATNKSVPSADQAGASPAEGEKKTKDNDKANLKQQPTTITPPNTSSFQSPLFPNTLKKEETRCDFEDDHANLADSMVETSKQKKFSFVTEGGEQIHLTVEKIEEQKRIEESLKAELAKQEVEKVKNELVDLMGTNVVTQPLKEQDPLEELNNLADKKRKRADDFKDHSNSTKKYKSSDQHKDEVH
ncbi:hypothetical protein Tco_1338954 [Tanacetum coccineum]